MLTGSHPPNTDVLTLDGWWLEGGIDAVHASCDPGSCPHAPRSPPYGKAARRTSRTFAATPSSSGSTATPDATPGARFMECEPDPNLVNITQRWIRATPKPLNS